MARGRAANSTIFSTRRCRHENATRAFFVGRTCVARASKKKRVRGLAVRWRRGRRVPHHEVGGEFVVVAGASASGKSTLLQVIAGLRTPDSGTVRWDGVDIGTVAAHRRGFGLVFQDALLFPHLDVAGNVGYAPR
ncbi:ATP-binding cassette domain-containing protein, partial [Lacticaseibacillus rhamnosus]